MFPTSIFPKTSFCCAMSQHLKSCILHSCIVICKLDCLRAHCLTGSPSQFLKLLTFVLSLIKIGAQWPQHSVIIFIIIMTSSDFYFYICTEIKLSCESLVSVTFRKRVIKQGVSEKLHPDRSDRSDFRPALSKYACFTERSPFVDFYFQRNLIMKKYFLKHPVDVQPCYMLPG